MEFNDDGLKGMALGAITVLFIWVVVGLNGCSQTYTVNSPATKETCVINMGVIQDCYPTQRVGE